MRGLYVGSVIMVMQVIACDVAGGGVAKTSGDLCAIKILFMKRIPAVHGGHYGGHYRTVGGISNDVTKCRN